MQDREELKRRRGRKVEVESEGLVFYVGATGGGSCCWRLTLRIVPPVSTGDQNDAENGSPLHPNPGPPLFPLAWSSGYKSLRLPSPLAVFNDLLLIPTPLAVKVFEKQILPPITAYISPIKFPLLPAKTFAHKD